MQREKPWKKRLIPLLICLAVLIVLFTSSILARYLYRSEEVQLEPAVSVEPTVKETVQDNAKTDVYIEVGETGYPVYVRAMIVITWQKGPGEPAGEDDAEEGDVYLTQPIEGMDYTIALNTEDWTKQGDFYYCNRYIASGGATPILIYRCAPAEDTVPPADGAVLSVEIIAQTVQAVGQTDGAEAVDAWKDAWGLQ